MPFERTSPTSRKRVCANICASAWKTAMTACPASRRPGAVRRSFSPWPIATACFVSARLSARWPKATSCPVMSFQVISIQVWAHDGHSGSHSGGRPLQPHGRRRQGPDAALWASFALPCAGPDQAPGLLPADQQQQRSVAVPGFRTAGPVRYPAGPPRSSGGNSHRPHLGERTGRNAPAHRALRHPLPAARSDRTAVSRSAIFRRRDRGGARSGTDPSRDRSVAGTACCPARRRSGSRHTVRLPLAETIRHTRNPIRRFPFFQSQHTSRYPGRRSQGSPGSLIIIFRRGFYMRFTCLAPLLLGVIATPVWAASPLLDAIAAGRPVIDLRARYENVGDNSKPVQTGEAGTLRARLGYETGAWNGLSVQADFDQLWLLGGDYNSTRNGKTTLPIIADPALTALNRLQLTYASDFDTKFVLGRQRLLIGNQRFIGNSGWRQHEQTFDALS